MSRDRPAVLITGASGFIGGAITERLVDRADVRSLTFHPAKNRFGNRVRSFAYDFDRPDRMSDAFRGVDVFFNSYTCGSTTEGPHLSGLWTRRQS